MVSDRGLDELARAVERGLATPDLAPSTERAYAHDWAAFVAFCARHELPALPAAPQTLALYLKSLETAWSGAPSAFRRDPPAQRVYVGRIGLAVPTLRALASMMTPSSMNSLDAVRHTTTCFYFGSYPRATD